jgi:hypothetical protein
VDAGASRGSSLRKPFRIKPNRRNLSSTAQWKDVPRGTMGEVSSHVRLVLPFD